MAIVTRYFSTASAGNRDGTTWANRARLFNSNVAVNSGTWSGPFTPGETATQTGTGATGLVELAGGSGAVLSLSGVTGTPNSSNVWTGGTSGATVTPTATPAENNWSMVIRDFNYTGNNSLHCRIGPGTYSCSQTLNYGLIPNYIPNVLDVAVVNNLSLLPCNNSGSLIRTWSPNWVSAQPVWDESAMPVIQTTTNIRTISEIVIFVEGIKFLATGRNGAVYENTGSFPATFANCVFQNATSNSAASAVVLSSSQQMFNCVFKCTGTAYSHVVQIVNTSLVFINCRIEGNATATSGSRNGYTNGSGGASHIFERCTFVNNPGNGLDFGIDFTSSGLSSFLRCIIANNGGDGVSGNTALTYNQGQSQRRFDKTIIVNNGGWAINQKTKFDVHHYSGCRMRNNTLGKFSLGSTGNFYEIDPDDSVGTDANEFVDAVNGDYRIKRTSSLWGKNLGPGDEPATGGAPLIGRGGLVY